MTTYTTIPNSDIDQDSPVTQPLMTSLRDNPIAITEGASGAPRIVNAAITDGTIQNAKIASSTLGAEKFQTGTTERNWVLARTAGASAGAVGTYAFLGHSSDNNTDTFGETRAGSQLRPAGIRTYNNEYFDGTAPLADTDHAGQNLALSGTWRCMGVARGGNGIAGASVWLRIS